MWLKAQNEMAGLWPHAAMGPVERRVRRQCAGEKAGAENLGRCISNIGQIPANRYSRLIRTTT